MKTSEELQVVGKKLQEEKVWVDYILPHQVERFIQQQIPFVLKQTREELPVALRGE